MRSTVVALAALGIVLVYAGITAPPIRHKSVVSAKIEAFAREAGLRRITGPGFLGSIVGLWLLLFFIAAGITTSLMVSGAIATAAIWLPIATIRSRGDKKRRARGVVWPDAIAMLIAAVRAGVSLPEACIGLTERGPIELKDGFSAFTSTYRASGSFAAGLVTLRNELADPVADRVAVALGLAYEVGGTDLVRVLRALGDFIREDLRIRKEIEARWSWTVTAARVAAGAPWVVLLLMSTQPEAATAYDSPTGVFVIALGAAATIVGYRLMLRAARLPDEPRLPL